MCVPVQKSVCQEYLTEGVYLYTVHKNLGIFYSLGECISLLLTVYLKISLIYMQYIIYIFKTNFYAKNII